jgi:hypothetical protein
MILHVTYINRHVLKLTDINKILGFVLVLENKLLCILVILTEQLRQKCKMKVKET